MSSPSEHGRERGFDEDRFLKKFLPGESRGISQLRTQIAILNATSNRDLVRNVLICGPSGAGKNYVAKVIAGHRQWLILRNTDDTDNKVENPLEAYAIGFAEVSLPGLPDTLVESELFGHEAGAFTGAIDRHEGYFREGYSDILLDEIGDASPALQAKLLRVLSSGQYRPVGGTKEHEATTDARLLLATNRDLFGMVRQGKFREDLLWRVRESVVFVPPLREQPDGVPFIVDNILAELYQKKPEALTASPKLTQADREFACAYTWPGNVRHLRHALVRWLVSGGRITLEATAREIEEELGQPHQQEGADPGIEDAVRLAIEEAREAGHPAAQTLGGFVEGFSGRARKAIFDWLIDARPTPQELKVLFPGHKNANAIRTQIRKWGAR